jgi:hypothetical protein
LIPGEGAVSGKVRFEPKAEVLNSRCVRSQRECLLYRS